MSRKKIAAGNWKMNSTPQEGLRLFASMMDYHPNADAVIICVPAIHIALLSQLDRPQWMHLGAQDISEHAKGAFTGEISGAMIAAAGARYVLIGHSERRLYHAESNALLTRKVNAAFAHKLTPIFCCGEPLEIRKSNEHKSFVINQLVESFSPFGAEEISKMIIAYEPIWAIGTGETASPDQAQEMHQAIRQHIVTEYGKRVGDNISILYGGSVKATNAPDIFGRKDVDGGLVGGASLDKDQFDIISRSFDV